MRFVWLICGLASLCIGIVGMVLPLIPTVPLVLLATFCFARSSPKLHIWLINHPKLGPHITDWTNHGAISTRSKKLATVSIVAVFAISFAFSVPKTVLLIQAVTLSAVLLFIWTRPGA